MLICFPRVCSRNLNGGSESRKLLSPFFTRGVPRRKLGRISSAANGSDATPSQNGNGAGPSKDPVQISADALNSYDRGSEREKELWRSIAKRTVNTVKPLTRAVGSWNTSSTQWLSLDKIRYDYYNQRKGTMDDLALFTVFNGIILAMLSLARASLAEHHEVWANIYSTYKLIFGEFEDDSAFAIQIFSVFVATVGFLAFALVLALVEQAFLESLEKNVRVGSPVMERGHILVVAFGKSPRDRESLLTICQQMCYAHKDIGGATIVILTETPKLEMQDWFRTALQDQLHGSTLVFRQGCPLVQNNLKLVNAPEAAATLIIGDQSRDPIEADAQSIRVAVLLDELGKSSSRDSDAPSHILVEVCNQDSVEMVHFACSDRVIPIGTARLNARRLVRILRQPIVGLTTRLLWDFNSDSRVGMEQHPELIGCRFDEVIFRFCSATPVGVMNGDRILLCPANDYMLGQGDELVMLRASGSRTMDPLAQPLPKDSINWMPKMPPEEFANVPPDLKISGEITEVTVDDEITQGIPWPHTEISLEEKTDMYIFPEHHAGSVNTEGAVHVLVVGWKTQQFMCALLHEMDRGRTQLPRGSHVTFFNEHPPESLAVVDEILRCVNVTSTHVCGSALRRYDIRKLDMTMYDCAMLLCDERWLDPDQDMANGYDEITTQSDLMRLQSVMMAAQINLRMALSHVSRDINIVAEKMAFGSATRFEDLTRLPLVSSVNFTSFSAKMLSFLAYYPKLLVPYFSLGDVADIVILDSSWVCARGELLSFADLQARTFKLQHLLLGFYELPEHRDKPLKLVVNPQGADVRLKERLWNAGTGRVKLVALTAADPTNEDPLIRKVGRKELQEFNIAASPI